MCLPFDNKIPNTFQGKRSVFQLQIIAFIQLALLFAREVAYFQLGELFELITIILLWSAWSSLGACQCLIYIIYSLYRVFITFIYFGTRFQNQVSILGENGKEKIINLLALISGLFFLISQYVVFLAYREFLALDKEKDYLVTTEERIPLKQEQQQQKQITTNQQQIFSGKGVRIG